MRKFFGIMALTGLAFHSLAQTDSTDTVNLEEAIIYSGKFAEKKKNVSQPVDVISARTITRFNAQNTGDLLLNTGQVFVQKSQQGGSSPVLRGFEASRVLLVVDGIRLNNAIYRAGHLQNVITVDQNMLERVEILYGPASTLYGSDALGGVVHLRTRLPQLSTTGKTIFTSSSMLRVSSANQENTIHTQYQLRGRKWGWIQSMTFSEFGDLRMGNKYPKKYPDFGRRTMLIETINQIDQLVPNPDDRIQKYSGYKQWDIAGKLLFKPDVFNTHILNLQHSNSSNVPRYDRLQDMKNFPLAGLSLRWAEWYYGPQTRYLVSYEWTNSNNSIADEIRLNINYQDSKESRQQREFQAYEKFDSRREHIKVAAFNFDLKEKWGNNELTAGIDGQFNFLSSTADRTNLFTGVVTPLDSRYPNGKNRMHYLGIYAQHLKKIKNGKWVLNDGIRLQTHSLYSTISDNSFFNFPFTKITQRPTALTWNMGLVHLPHEKLRASTNLSSGFRTPNIDDASRVFESSGNLQRLVVPNPDIKPEYTYSWDLQLKYSTEKYKTEITAFFTLFRNAIALAPFQLEGRDSILYNGTLSQVIANQNARKAFIRGLNYRLDIKLTPSLDWETTLSSTYGRFTSGNKAIKPMDHIPPFFGKSSLLYKKNTLQGEFYIHFNGWKRIEDFNMNGEDNAQYATPDGMPSWYTLNLRASWQLYKSLQVQAGLENILDRNYRYFASGFSAPGRNLYLTLRTNF
ncbi:MAG: TonB-dependent receptor plug domain-containing protein [Chitinophagaceae bacterium]